MRMYTKAGRSRWPYVIGAVVVVIAVAGGVIYSVSQPSGQPTASSEPTPSASEPSTGGSSGAGDNEDGVAPTGCLGGQDRNAEMVLAAQKEAKHTTYGAVEMATSFYRWTWQYPNPPTVESDVISERVLASTANDDWKDVAAQYESDAWNRLVAEYKARGGAFHTSSTNGLWRVTEDSTTDRVNVELALGYVVDGELSPTRSTGIGLVLVWQNEAWHVEGGTPLDQDKLAAGGTRFTGGC